MQAKNRYSCPVCNSLLQKHVTKNMPERAYMHDNEKIRQTWPATQELRQTAG